MERRLRPVRLRAARKLKGIASRCAQRRGEQRLEDRDDHLRLTTVSHDFGIKIERSETRDELTQGGRRIEQLFQVDLAQLPEVDENCRADDDVEPGAERFVKWSRRLERSRVSFRP